MGVYINMEMPENCALCPVWDAGNCLVATEAIICEYTKRPSDCPLVPVPPHGKLIDANALDCIGYCCIPKSRNDTFDDGVMWLVEQIDSLPTIIPAEEGE